MAEKFKPAQLITTGDAENNIVVWNKAKRIADYLSAGGESAAKGDVTRLLEQVANLLDDRDTLAAKVNEIIAFGDSLENLTTDNIAPKDEYRITQGIVENGSGSGNTKVSSLKDFKEDLDTVLKGTSELYSLQNAIDSVPVLARKSTTKSGNGNLPSLAMKYLRLFGPTNDTASWVEKTAAQLNSANHFNQAALIRTPTASVVGTSTSAADVTAKLRDIFLSGTGEWLNLTNAVRAVVNSSTSSVVRLGVVSPSAINYTAATSGHSVSIPAANIKINNDPFGDSTSGLKSYVGTYDVYMEFGSEVVPGAPTDPVTNTTHAPIFTFNFNSSNGPTTKSRVKLILVRKADGAVMSEAMGYLK